MKKVIMCLIFCASFLGQAWAQDDKEAIQTVLNNYFEGWTIGDTLKLGKVMHSSCKLKTYRDNVLNVTDRNKYLSNFKPRSKDADTRFEILSIDFTENIANAKLTISTAKYIFTDYMNLIKTNEGWIIMDKISCRKDK